MIEIAPLMRMSVNSQKPSSLLDKHSLSKDKHSLEHLSKDTVGNDFEETTSFLFRRRFWTLFSLFHEAASRRSLSEPGNKQLDQ
jgi:hypothetical protein